MKPFLFLSLLFLSCFHSFAQNNGKELEPRNSGTIKIYDFAEVSPEFPGGEDSLNAWINRNIELPAKLKNNKYKGRIYVRFEVLKNGQTVNPRIIKGLNEEVDKEVIRLLRKMPKWKPGTVKGREVHVRMYVPLEIKLNN